MICLTITSVFYVPQALIQNSGTVTYIKICHDYFPQLPLPTQYPLNTMLALFLGLTEHHTTKTCGGNGDIAPRIVNLATRCRSVVSLTPRLFTGVDEPPVPNI
jgi:hypothetical protein